ncbi:PLP-dependent aminotransferase family protein [Bosea sp. BK604]|uniref:MocR-like pyridoxine biosynthesis transcription factor PdxR n=1 Tax=Bosea sp. BK604 TaxID=2512180 RepID=UPI0010D7BB71|nr:PLP-dependent aminotransferase family protein [Bosea sp. BK604]TCR60635.1 GntR family transcriptional regulator [Bosea sp. BK604]
MTLHIRLDGQTDLTGQIYRQVRRAILDGRLRPGDRLPPSRELARTLSVSRLTVTIAYERLAGEGFVRTAAGSGTFVSSAMAGQKRDEAPAIQAADAISPRPIWDTVVLPTAFDRPAIYDFRTGLPDGALFPHRSWRRLVGRELRAAETSAMIYGQPGGASLLRSAIARHVAVSRGIDASEDRILITSGTQQALDIVARVVLTPGDTIAVEDPGYEPPRHLFRSLGLQVAGVPVDHEGIVVDRLPNDARAVYVTPSHQYPLGVVMSMRRRRALLQWAERRDALIIEDDYDSEFRFVGRPLEPLQTIDAAGRVIYVGSFSKTLSPSIRLGFLFAPASLLPALRKAKYVSDWYAPELLQNVLGNFIAGGGFARHIRKAGAVYRSRRRLIEAAIRRDFREHLDVVPSETGLHLTATAKHLSAAELELVAGRARERGVAVHRLVSFAVTEAPRAGLVLGFGAIRTDQIEPGLKILHECFR